MVKDMMEAIHLHRERRIKEIKKWLESPESYSKELLKFKELLRFTDQGLVYLIQNPHTLDKRNWSHDKSMFLPDEEYE